MQFPEKIHTRNAGPRVARYYIVSPTGRIKSLPVSGIIHYPYLVSYTQGGSGTLEVSLTPAAQRDGWTELEQDFKSAGDAHGWDQWLSYQSACSAGRADGEFPRDMLPPSVIARMNGATPEQTKWKPEPKQASKRP